MEEVIPVVAVFVDVAFWLQKKLRHPCVIPVMFALPPTMTEVVVVVAFAVIFTFCFAANA